MSSVESVVGPEEPTVVRTGLHPVAFGGALGMALFIGLVVALLIRHNDLPLRTDVQIAVVGALVAALGAVPSWLRWRNTSVVVTDRHIVATAGVRGQHHLELPMADATVSAEAGRLGRALDHATLSIVARDGRSWSIGHVAHARAVVEASPGGSTRRRPSGPGGDQSRRERAGRD
jgi:membrane protein YdbS with pleckstrin-like domain